MGNNLNVTGPPPEDLGSTTNSYIEVLLTATDSWGLTATVSKDVDPALVDVTFATSPVGLDLVVAGETISASTITMWDGWTTRIEAPGPGRRRRSFMGLDVVEPSGPPGP